MLWLIDRLRCASARQQLLIDAVRIFAAAFSIHDVFAVPITDYEFGAENDLDELGRYVCWLRDAYVRGSTLHQYRQHAKQSAIAMMVMAVEGALPSSNSTTPDLPV